MRVIRLPLTIATVTVNLTGNSLEAGTGLNRLFLHAAALKFTHPGTGEVMRIEAPMDEGLKRCLQKLRNAR